MYCQSCGASIAQGLSYCNRCGVSLIKRESSEAGPVATLATATTIVSLGGLGLILGGLIALKEAGLPGEVLVGFMLLCFLIIVIVDFGLLWQLSHVLKRSRLPRFEEDIKAPASISAAHPAALAEPGMSVTENTTRTLDAVYRNQ